MQHSFRAVSILALTGLILFSLTACGRNSTDNIGVVFPILLTTVSEEPTPGELCNNDLYPTKQGAIWVYASTSGSNGAFIYTDSVTEKRADGFKLTTQLNNITHTQEWSCRPEGLTALQLGGGNTASISLQDMTSGLSATDITGINLPQKITDGMQWQYSLKLQGTIVMPGDPQAPASGTYSMEMQQIGQETITVPAGTFETIKIQSNTMVEIISSFSGAELPIKFSGTTVTWYAPGVGYVKVTENGDYGGELFSVNTELQSYNIP
jgi:hypothetical protein